MDPRIQELISALSSEIAILRVIAEHPDSSNAPLEWFERARLAKARTQAAAITVVAKPE